MGGASRLALPYSLSSKPPGPPGGFFYPSFTFMTGLPHGCAGPSCARTNPVR
ncbi:hypothetical protein BamMEX5DRAFT_3825 [Burkholderia ambifaria MEX-5]|uniref:Uncharacterized protein n=1 Tax=Burkholderia ambifaria MEX-5 TaxID=396597 RepID=B1T7Q9_9BURK|nr:hypothetical protein BamMEX5DRAFT_3825 [Burkholderia ambifaria MEX-5]